MSIIRLFAQFFNKKKEHLPLNHSVTTMKLIKMNKIKSIISMPKTKTPIWTFPLGSKSEASLTSVSSETKGDNLPSPVETCVNYSLSASEESRAYRLYISLDGPLFHLLALPGGERVLWDKQTILSHPPPLLPPRLNDVGMRLREEQW